MKEIALTQGYATIVDDEDYEITPFLYDVEHECSEDCWCEPDIVEIGEDITIFRHNRGVC